MSFAERCLRLLKKIPHPWGRSRGVSSTPVCSGPQGWSAVQAVWPRAYPKQRFPMLTGQVKITVPPLDEPVQTEEFADAGRVVAGGRQTILLEG